MSIVYRTRKWLTIPQLVSAWALELSKDKEQSKRDEQALRDSLLEDIINGRLDEAGPLVDGRRLGLRLELGGRPCFISGHEIQVFFRCSPPAIALDQILIMKEAVLDFAWRYQLPLPSWWADDSTASSSAQHGSELSTADGKSTVSNLIAASPISTPSDSARTRGRKPTKRQRAAAAMSKAMQEGRTTESGLRDMPEKQLAAEYGGVSRDTARKARNEALSAISSKPQLPPNSTSTTSISTSTS